MTLVLVNNRLALPTLAGEGGAPRERRDGWGQQRLRKVPHPFCSRWKTCYAGAGFERIRFHAPTMMSQMFTAHQVRLNSPVIVQ